MSPFASFLCVAVAATALLRAQRHDDVTFTYAGTVPSGYAVYLSGDLDELGANHRERSIRMAQPSPGTWRITVRLPANRTFQYSYHQRSAVNPNLIGNPSHGTLLSGPSTGVTASRAIAPASKRLVGHLPLANAQLFWRQGAGVFQGAALLNRGPGRAAGEWLYEAPAFGSGGLPVEFYCTDGTGSQRLPTTGAYTTPLDAFFLQDDEMFTYWPAPSVTPLQRAYVPANPPSFFSTVMNGTRAYRVILPRGYQQHTWRRYPVLYFHDGPWMFDPGNLILYFSDVIDPNGDTTAGLVRRGEMGECILVGVDWGTTNGALAEVARARDYLPVGATWTAPLSNTVVQGAAANYVQFLLTELKPLIDSNYRTLPGRATTWTSGFSFGGVVSAYLGWNHGQDISRVGLFSPSFWVAGFPQQLLSAPLPFDLRTYMDSGFDNYSWTANTRDNWLARPSPYRLHSELCYAFDAVSTQHTPTEVNRRLPAMERFLYPASEEPNEFLVGAVPYGTGSGAAALDLAWQQGATPHIANAVASAPAPGAWAGLVGLSTAPASLMIAGIELLVEPTSLAILPVVAAANGQASVSLGLASVSLAGQRFYLQVAQLGASGISVSNGLEVDLGR